MKNLEITVEKVQELMHAFSKSKIDIMNLEDGDFKLSFEKKGEVVMASSSNISYAAETASCQVIEQAEPVCSGKEIKSPIVGTFYITPAPDKEPFVKVGDKVKKGDVLFIIESMKLMNEITSETDGTVVEILVQNGQAVEFGQPIMVLE